MHEEINGYITHIDNNHVTMLLYDEDYEECVRIDRDRIPHKDINVNDNITFNVFGEIDNIKKIIIDITPPVYSSKEDVQN